MTEGGSHKAGAHTVAILRHKAPRLMGRFQGQSSGITSQSGWPENIGAGTHL